MDVFSVSACLSERLLGEASGDIARKGLSASGRAESSLACLESPSQLPSRSAKARDKGAIALHDSRSRFMPDRNACSAVYLEVREIIL